MKNSKREPPLHLDIYSNSWFYSLLNVSSPARSRLGLQGRPDFSLADLYLIFMQNNNVLHWLEIAGCTGINNVTSFPEDEICRLFLDGYLYQLL
jgi:hypothetical protein